MNCLCIEYKHQNPHQYNSVLLEMYKFNILIKLWHSLIWMISEIFHVAYLLKGNCNFSSKSTIQSQFLLLLNSQGPDFYFSGVSWLFLNASMQKCENLCMQQNLLVDCWTENLFPFYICIICICCITNMRGNYE